MTASRRAHTARRPFQYSSAEIVFEHLHLSGHGRLRNVGALGSPAEAAFLYHGHKQAELIKHGLKT